MILSTINGKWHFHKMKTTQKIVKINAKFPKLIFQFKHVIIIILH